MQPTKIAKLTTLPLTLLMIGAIDSIRNLPSLALFGQSIIFFFVFAAIFFLLPTALVAAELSSQCSENNNGIYYWVSAALGKNIGVLAVWLQWINTIVWFPTVLAFVAGTMAYLFAPQLAQQPVFLITVILSAYWLLTWIGCWGLDTSAKVANYCTIIGVVLPFLLLLGCALAWLINGQPLHLHLDCRTVLPNLKQIDTWFSLTAVITTFLGIELSAVHIKEIVNPEKTFPAALAWTVCCTFVPMMLGGIAIAIILPQSAINLNSGVMQTFANLLAIGQQTRWLPVLATILLIGSFGSMTSWLISPAKGLLQVASDHYLPQSLTRLNSKQVASRLLMIQGILVSLLALAFILMPSINGAYWFLTTLSTQLYLFMYLLLFIAAIVGTCHKKVRINKVIPGQSCGIFTVCSLGIIGCLVAIGIGFVPPSEIAIGNPHSYALTFFGGLFGLTLPTVLLYLYKYRKRHDQS
jgi:amino acid transporter